MTPGRESTRSRSRSKSNRAKRGQHPIGIPANMSAVERSRLHISARNSPMILTAGSARQAPLHRLHAAGIAAADDDAKITARPFERLQLDVSLGGRLLDVAHAPGAGRERVLEELLRARQADYPIYWG